MTSETDISIIRSCLLFFAIFGIFGNLNIVIATRRNKNLQHKCGILLAILAICDTICLLNEFQSFLRMTFDLGQTTLNKCFYFNLTYILIEPLEVYMIFILAIDRLIAINYSIFYRKIPKSKYILSMLIPGLIIAAIFLISSFLNLPNSNSNSNSTIIMVDSCILPYSMPENVSYWWNQYNLWGAVATLFIYFYTYVTVYCCILSAILIVIFTNMKNAPIDPDTVSTYAVIPGLISYSCNFYVYFWRSSDYYNAFVKQLFCGRNLGNQENLAPPSKKSSSVSVMVKKAQET
ncbi:unnamed protein product [Caenorhabditis angaria]|uniref:G-protein coupled receptors family 1 profile domain-containing protein n=1 Tax=Caenorhabditis angaria TaxID=860376 RepID=A0A9P1MUE1_9PELO|nr:unnamed protein product [Caenorhabditis angaria]